MTPRPEVREKVLAMLRMRGSATQKQILNSVAGNRREGRDECFAAIEELLAEDVIEIVSRRFGASSDGQACGWKATRYAIVRRSS